MVPDRYVMTRVRYPFNLSDFNYNSDSDSQFRIQYAKKKKKGQTFRLDIKHLLCLFAKHSVAAEIP